MHIFVGLALPCLVRISSFFYRVLSPSLPSFLPFFLSYYGVEGCVYMHVCMHACMHAYGWDYPFLWIYLSHGGRKRVAGLEVLRKV